MSGKNGKGPIPASSRRDQLGQLIEYHERAFLETTGSFMGSDIFEAVLRKKTKFRMAIRRMEKTFPEFDVATAYEAQVRYRILRIAKELGCVSVPVNGTDYTDKVRWVLPEEAYPDEIEKSAKAKQVFAGKVHAVAEQMLEEASLARLDSDEFLRLTDG